MIKQLQTVYVPTKDLTDFEKILIDSLDDYLIKTKVYLFTPEELKQLLYNSFEAGYNYGYDSANMDEGYSVNYKNKEQYIENLLNKKK